jgi:uncharacterized protein (DUF302 family)
MGRCGRRRGRGGRQRLDLGANPAVRRSNETPELGPTEVLIFGNPRSGTPLMQVAKTVAIDLPLNAIVWQNEQGNTCVAYYEPKWLAHRHGVPVAFNELLDAMTDKLAAVVKQATQRKPERS